MIDERKIGSIYAAVERKNPGGVDVSGVLVFDVHGKLKDEWSGKTVSFGGQTRKRVSAQVPPPRGAGAEIHDIGPQQIFLLDRRRLPICAQRSILLTRHNNLLTRRNDGYVTWASGVSWFASVGAVNSSAL